MPKSNSSSPSTTRTAKFAAPSRVNAWAQVTLLLIVATLLDKVTGPYVSAAAFYIFPIGLAGWRIRGKAAALIVAISIALNALTIWLDTKAFSSDLVASQFLQAFVYGAVAFLTTRVRADRLLLEEQKERLNQLNDQMAGEMRAARSLQELLFVIPPRHPAVEVGTFLAAARILGGDALDVSFSGNILAVLIADVSGKGSAAALATAVLVGMLDQCPNRFASPARTLEFLNERLSDRLPENMFVTAFYLLLNLENGETTWASAGHEPPLVINAGAAATQPQKRENVRELVATAGTGNNMPLAVLSDTIYAEHHFVLLRGEVLFCYSDGLPDLRLPSGKRLGMENLKALFAKYATSPCSEISEAILVEITGQSKEHFLSGFLEDDLSSVALRLK